MSFSDTQPAKRYAAIAEVAAAQAKIYAQELEEAPNYAAEAASSAEAAANSSSSASQYAGNAAEAATSSSSSASAAAASAASAASAAQSAIGQTVRAPQGETLSQLPAAASRQNQYIATDSAGNVTIVPRSSIPVLDSNGKLPVSTIPAIALTQPFVVSSQSAMLALDAQPGDIAKRTDLGYSFCLAASPASTLSNWIQLTDDVLAQLGMSSGASQVGATSLIGASSTVQAELSKKPDSTNLAASNGALAIGALDDSGSATTMQGALNLKLAIAKIIGTGTGQGAKIVGTVQPFTNAVARTQDSKNLETVSVKDFGAVGDGVADDTTAFSNALNALYGKTACLFIPAGNYRISSRIDFDLGLNTHIEIRGAGNNLVEIRAVGASQSVFKITGPAGNIWLNSVTPNGTIDFKDLSFACYGGVDGAGNCLEIQTGCVLGGPSKNTTFENVTFRCDSGWWNVHVYFRNTAQIHFTNCMFYSGNNVKAGIGVFVSCDPGSDGSGLYFSQCDFYFLYHGVYHSDHFEGVSFNGCGFGNCNYGFTSICVAESGASITNCGFDCYVEGIHLEGLYDFVIHGNTFLGQGSGVSGIAVIGGNGFTIVGNKMTGWNDKSGTGIFLQNNNASLNRTGYIGDNAINNYNIAMSVNGSNNLTFGDFSWYNCNLDTLLSGTNTNIQDAGYTLSKSVVATLASSTTEWTLSVDISSRKLTRKPVYAALVSNSLSSMIIRYDNATSTNTSAVFKITLASGANIPANTYGFSLFINTPMFQ